MTLRRVGLGWPLVAEGLPVAKIPLAAEGLPAAEGLTSLSARRTSRDDRGSFTAELAAGLPALMLLLLVGLTTISAVSTKLQCVDAARAAALAASRGESGEAAGHGVAPAGAAVVVLVEGERVTVTVEAPIRPFGARLPTLTAHAFAIAAVEPGAPGVRG